MKYILLLISLMLSHTIAVGKEESFSFQNRSLIVSNDYYTIEYKNDQGKRFPLYFYNDLVV